VTKLNSDIATEILRASRRREIRDLCPYACRSSRGRRQFPERERIPDRANVRSIFTHDADRIIHSKAYARYIDKTQVFYLIENDHVTRRVLHVQIVSKIARSIGRMLRLNEDLIEAISLGHDVGHSPYGHNGEKILQDFCDQCKIGTFAHNAQSVRLLTELEEYGSGLNLSLQVLDGILGHNGEMLQEKYRPVQRITWEQLLSQYLNCMSVLEASKELVPATLEACVMRISDVIAYVGRDIEDAIQVNLVKRKELPARAKKVLGKKNAEIINSLVSDLINNSYDKDCLTFSPEVFEALNELLWFNYECIYSNDKKKAQDDKIANMFRTVLNRYTDDLERDRADSPIYQWALKGFRRDYMRTTPKARIVVDYVAGMTDDFLNRQFQEMVIPRSFGHKFRSG
jgi:dGTPase